MLPTTVQIGTQRYIVKVASEEDLGKGNLGDIDHNINLIRILDSAPRSRQVGILLHECLHGMLITYEFKNEEKIVLALEETLALFLMDNTSFMQATARILSDEKNNPQSS